MDELRRAAILTLLADRLITRGSWSGETHLQKATYLLQEVCNVPLNFEFILYRHGPFSFDLRDEVSDFRAGGLLEVERRPPYGPTLFPSQAATEIRKRLYKTVAEVEQRVDFVAEHIQSKNVMELERLTTAVWVIKAKPAASDDDAATALREIKPHVSSQSAVGSVQQARSLLHDWEAALA